jgi:SAM-dependent methyltransferase
MTYEQVRANIITLAAPVFAACKQQTQAGTLANLPKDPLIPPASYWTKYINQVNEHIERAYNDYRKLGLHQSQSLHVLDIGSGAGYFAYICSQRHKVLTIDDGEVFFYKQMINTLGLDQLIRHVQAYQPLLLPIGFIETFDLITAFHVCFDLGPFFATIPDNVWKESEWDYFITDLLQYVRLGGRIHFDLLRKQSGWCMSPEVFTLLSSKYKVTLQNTILQLRKG